jgi:hypothetical protein
MTDTDTQNTTPLADAQAPAQDFEEFEIGEHKVPTFLWVFFILIVSWASISWIKFFGY